MRATIKFEVDVDQVENTMATVVAMEADTLRAIADMIDVNPGPRTMVLEEVTEALRLLSEVTIQLHQYQQMLGSFEQAKFETMLPQSAAPSPVPSHSTGGPIDLGSTLDNMRRLDSFIDSINEQGSEENVVEAKEG